LHGYDERLEVNMSEQSETIVPAAPTVQPRDPLVGVRQLAYAWVGLWGVAAEDLSKLYQRCVARGEQIMNSKSSATPTEVKPSTPDVAATEPKKSAPKAIRPTSIFNAFGAVESYHIDLNAEEILPTKQELDALSERVEALSREVDALVEQRKQGQ
jgi:polyhydroxyalkanoate synthesis regulator phasin